MFRTKYFTMVEVKMPANSQANKTYTFETQTQVQTIIGDQTVLVEAIETYNISDITNSPLTTANPVAAQADIINATLTLMFGGFEGISQIPLASLKRTIPIATVSASVFQLMTFRDMVKIDWTKSKITLVANAPTATAFSYVFGIYYDYLTNL